jgi:hypothetical protein
MFDIKKLKKADPLEADTSHKIIAKLTLHGSKVRKIDDRYGGVPDYLFTHPHDNHSAQFVEMKIVDRSPPWTARELGLRPSQIAFFRTWPGTLFIAAYWPLKSWWFIGASPEKFQWHHYESHDAAALVLLNGRLPFKPEPWLVQNERLAV